MTRFCASLGTALMAAVEIFVIAFSLWYSLFSSKPQWLPQGIYPAALLALLFGVRIFRKVWSKESGLLADEAAP